MSKNFSNMIESSLITSVNEQMREIPANKSASAATSKLNGKQTNGKLVNGNNSKNSSINSASSSTKMGSLEEQFKAATNAIQNLPKNGPFQPSNEMLLKFYGYYKQAVSGPCNTSRPSLFKVVERAKWDAWNSVKNLTKDEAMYNYIEEVKKIVETMPHNEHVQKLIEVIGPFFEYVNENEQPEEDEEEEEETEEDEEVATTTTTSTENNKELNGSTYLIKSTTTTMTESYDNIGKNMFDSFSNNKLPLVNGNNGHLNGDSAKSNNNLVQNASDDEEDYCDTSDYLSEHDLNNQSIKKVNGTNSNNDLITHDSIYNNNQTIIRPKVVKNGFKEENRLNGINDYNHNHLLLLNNSSCLQRINGKSNLMNGNSSSNELDILINKLGGEIIGGSGGIPYQQSSLIRSSRPSSSLSNTGFSRGIGGGGGGHNGGPGGGGSGGSGGGSGGGGGGGNDGNNFLMSQESNRQILLLLLRLQQDTNNVLTRLSYLETTVMSIQSNLQMNRLENSIQLNHNNNNQQVGSAFSLVSNNNPTHAGQISNNNKQSSFIINFIRSIDWKTVAIAVLWPLIIRLVFFFLKKVRFVIKFRKSRP